MTDDLTPYEDLFDRLGDGVPDRRPSMAQISGLGATARRRRTTLTALAAAAAVVLVLAGSAVAVGVSGGHRTSPVVADSPPGLPAADPGYKYVGRGRVVVQVPEDAVLITTDCGTSGPGYSLGPVEIVLCLQISTSHYPLSVDMQPVSGQPPFRALDCSIKGCSQTVTRDGIRIIMSGTKTKVDRLRSSIRVLPVGYTAVPLISGKTTQFADKATATVGLHLAFRSTPPPYSLVRSQQPAAGTVVKSGSLVVAIAKGAAPAPLTTDQLEGVWVPVSVDGKPVTARGGDLLRFSATTVTAPTQCRPATARYTLDGDGAFHAGPLEDFDRCLRLEGVDSADLLNDTATLSVNPTVPGANRVLVLRDARGHELATYRFHVVHVFEPGGS